MITEQSTKNTTEALATRVQEIAAQLAGFKPTLDQYLEDVDQDIGNVLAMLGGMAEYVQRELTDIGGELTGLLPNDLAETPAS